MFKVRSRSELGRWRDGLHWGREWVEVAEVSAAVLADCQIEVEEIIEEVEELAAVVSAGAKKVGSAVKKARWKNA